MLFFFVPISSIKLVQIFKIMKTLLKSARELKGYTIREVAQQLIIDKALISKFESGTRKPTKEQIIKLAALLNIDQETLLIAWLKDKILEQIEDDPLALKVLQEVEKTIKNKKSLSGYTISDELKKYLITIDQLKLKLCNYKGQVLENVLHQLDINYTYESNRLEGNTLSFEETELVVNKGMTIAGKSMKEHLEAINHYEAFINTRNDFSKKFILTTEIIVNIQNLMGRGIQNFNEDLKNIPQTNQLENDPIFNWFETNKNNLHPLILAVKTHEFLIKHSSTHYLKESVLRLIMNVILSSKNYLITTIPANTELIAKYHEVIKNAQSSENDESYLIFIAQAQIISLEKVLNLLKT